uniref:Variant surface glycoprotein 547 n=1 Tax=Trypanosoma brucei TaxID=5691 RepID=M4TDH1_9TRYP|nr:variant surface glycoprotein 547 [Trypanosoma brucei]
MLTAIVGAIALCFSGISDAADMAAGVNRAEHGALCAFVSMAAGTVQVPVVPAVDEVAYDYIQNLNFSTSPEDWQSMFYVDATKQKVHESPQEAKHQNKGYEPFWEDWKKAAAAVAKADGNEKLKTSGALNLNSVERQLAHAQIQKIAAAARKLKLSFPQPDSATAALTGVAAQQILTKAALGGEAATATNIDNAKAFGGSNSGNRDAVCEAKTSGARPASAVAALACVCLKGNANAITDGACTRKSVGTTAWQAAAGTFPSNTELHTQAKACGSRQGAAVSSADLKNALQNLQSLVHTDGTDGYLGTFESTGCNGSSGNGVCIKFGNYVADGQAAFDKLGWTKDLRQLTQQLDTLAVAEKQAAIINKFIQAKAEAATASIGEAKLTGKLIQAMQQTNGQNKKIDIKQFCETHNNSKTKCLGAKCAWKGQKEDDGPCVVDESKVAEQTNTAGAGEQANQEAGGKDRQTNTTGNNSFFIHKTPLLFAFLLF